MEAMNWICLECKHLRPIEGGCDAFPWEDGGIPDAITSGKNKHSKPLPDQKNKIVFEQKEINLEPNTETY